MTRVASPPIRRPLAGLPYTEFLVRYRNGERVEWVNGEAVPMPPIGEGHTESLHFLIAILRVFVRHFDLGKLQADPFQMKTGPDLPGRQPDLLFVAKRNLGRLHPNHLEGPADVAIEIASPSTRLVNRIDKFKEYETGGVREYWIIDPIRKSAEFYRLGRDGKFRAAKIENGVFRSRVIKDSWLRIEWLWTDPEPVDVFRELGIFK